MRLPYVHFTRRFSPVISYNNPLSSVFLIELQLHPQIAVHSETSIATMVWLDLLSVQEKKLAWAGCLSHHKPLEIPNSPESVPFLPVRFPGPPGAMQTI